MQTFGDHWVGADLVLRHAPETVLEIGMGQRILYNYLDFLGVQVAGLDIDPALSPDLLADIRDLPVRDRSFDVVCGFEVLEHLPYEELVPVATRCLTAARSAFIFSVPDVRFILALDLRVGIGTRNLLDLPLRVAAPRLFKRKLGAHQEHFWEIGRSGFPLSRVLRDLSGLAGVRRMTHFRSRATNSIRYFVLER